MQLASLQPVVAPALAGGVLLLGVGALRPHGWVGRVRSTVGVLLLAALALLAIVGLVLGVVLLIRAEPEQAPVVVVAGMTLLGVVGFAVHTRRSDGPPPPPESAKTDEDGGGGQRRTETDPKPKTPPAAPAAPTGPGVPWAEFDDVRAGWDRVPAGRS